MQKKLPVFNLKFLVILITILANYWVWRITVSDPLLAVVLLLLTISLYQLLNEQAFSFGKRNSSLWITILLFIFTSVLSLNAGLDKNLWSLSYIEENKLNDRHFYYAVQLGKIYQNKLSTYVYKNITPFSYQLKNNIFSALDLNLYFFKSHPRERSGIEEFKKYPSLFLPFFIVGGIFLGLKKPKIILCYLGIAVLINGFISQSYNLGPILFFPLISLMIAFGEIVILEKLVKVFKHQIDES